MVSIFTDICCLVPLSNGVTMIVPYAHYCWRCGRDVSNTHDQRKCDKNIEISKKYEESKPLTIPVSGITVEE